MTMARRPQQETPASSPGLSHGGKVLLAVGGAVAAAGALVAGGVAIAKKRAADRATVETNMPTGGVKCPQRHVRFV